MYMHRVQHSCINYQIMTTCLRQTVHHTHTITTRNQSLVNADLLSIAYVACSHYEKLLHNLDSLLIDTHDMTLLS